jgi:hypothetical protein
VKRSGPPKRRKPLSRGEKARPVGARTDPGPVKFRPRRSAQTEPCARCSSPQQPCRADDWHHWLAQQHIRVYVRGLRLSQASSRALLRRLLHDARNLVALCRDCHAAHELRSRPLTGGEVPHVAWTFALELGPEWVERLHRAYPGGAP